MRRRTLDPPRAAAHGDLVEVPLDAPHHAKPVPRAHFDPKAGWFRRIERKTSLFLSRHVWPRVPGTHLHYGWILGHHLTVAEADIPIAGLPPAFDGTTVMFISDVHAGPFLSAGALAKAFSRLATLRPDVLIHGGDLTTSNVKEARIHEPALTAFTAPLGVFAIFGNHDHYTRDPEGVAALYARCGVRLINNDAVALDRDGAKLALAGIDDWNFGRPDLDGALAAAKRVAPGAPVVLASHNPDSFFAAAGRGVALTISGHTHGGQVRIPGRPVLVRMSRYFLDEGRYDYQGAQIVVTRGLGVSGIPVRIFCPPEALLLTLRAAR